MCRKFVALFPLLLTLWCRPAQTPQEVVCDGKARPTLDCSSEVSYQGVRVSGATGVLNLVKAEGGYEEDAIRAIRPRVEEYVAKHTRLCREYNACVVNAERYHAETKELGERLSGLDAIATEWEGADYGKRKQLLARVYDAVVPPSESGTIQFRLRINTVLPPSLGGGSGVLRPGEPIPSGAQVTFDFEVSTDAHLYLFQKLGSGSLNVLFPDARAGVTNPLRGGQLTRIPAGGGFYRLNDEDLGTEHVFIVVSQKPLESLSAALERVNAGQITNISGDQLLSNFTSIAPGVPPDGCNTRALRLEKPESKSLPCTRSRGLILEAGTSAASIAVRTDPGDDRIVKVFPFEHVTEGTYAAAHAGWAAPTPAGEKSRGIIIETPRR